MLFIIKELIIIIFKIMQFAIMRLCITKREFLSNSLYKNSVNFNNLDKKSDKKQNNNDNFKTLIKYEEIKLI